MGFDTSFVAGRARLGPTFHKRLFSGHVDFLSGVRNLGLSTGAATAEQTDSCVRDDCVNHRYRWTSVRILRQAVQRSSTFMGSRGRRSGILAS